MPSPAAYTNAGLMSIFPALRAMFLKAADLFRLNIDHPHLPMLCFISVGDGPYSPGAANWRVPWKKLRTGKLVGRAVRDPEQGTTHRKRRACIYKLRQRLESGRERGARKADPSRKSWK